MNVNLTVVIPCYNEEQNIRLGSLDKVARYMEKQKYSWEVLIVDDGSTDMSLNLIKEFIRSNGKGKFRVLEEEHHGKATTLIMGMLAGNGKYLLFTDLDQATPISEMEKLMQYLDKGYDIVIGSRRDRREGAPFLRRLMGPGFSYLRNLILGLGTIKDTQCGFKVFERDAARNIFKRLKLYKEHRRTSGPRVTAGFDVEVLYVAQYLGYKIKEVPVEWHYVDTRRVSPLVDSIDALIDIVRIRLKSLRHEYDTKDRVS